MHPSRFAAACRRRLPFALAVAAAPLACTAMSAVGAVAFEAGRQILVGKAEENYDKPYADAMTQLINMLAAKVEPASVQPAEVQSAAAQSAAAQSAAVEPASAQPASVHPAPVQPAAVKPNLDKPKATSEIMPQAFREAPSLDVLVVRQEQVGGVATATPLADGDVVRDGVGRDTNGDSRVDQNDGDNLKLRITPRADCWLYAVWIDATAWAEPVFPFGKDAAFTNPVHAGQALDVPASDDWFFLDEHRGTETLYVLASREPRPDLEQALRALVGRTRPVTAANGGALQPVQQTAEISRGLGGTRPGRKSLVTTQDGAQHEVTATLFEASKGTGDLVITRWFRHE